MAFDGLFLNRIKHEIETAALESRIDKVHQPSREVVVLTLRAKGGAVKLLLSAGANSPRIHFTQIAADNPSSPPMFCMLMRKHLSSGKLVAVRQIGLDRILHLDFETTNEFGDKVVMTLAVEIMSRHSNIILIDPDGKIVDAVKRIGEDMSSVRPILPGMRYVLPPVQDKLSLFDASPRQILDRVLAGRDVPLSKGLMDALQGVSPLVCREISHFATRGQDTVKADLDEEQKTRLLFSLSRLSDSVCEYSSQPTMLLDLNHKPRDFSFMDITQYGHTMEGKRFETCSKLLDGFYSERDRMDRMRQRSGDLLRQIVNLSDRILRRIQTQKEELKQSEDRERLKIYGDLISANLYGMQKGDTEVTVGNFYEEGMPEVTIKLDPMLTPVQNSQKYYLEYRKADTAEKKLTTLIRQGEEEYEYVDSVFDALTRAVTEAELEAIRQELAAQGYIKLYKGKGQKLQKLSPLKYLSTDGFIILCGRNNLQNDKLTLKDSRPTDIWLHTQKIPGSHVVIVTEGKDVPNGTLEQAAVIAAYNSKARESYKVAVDYTPVRYVKKPGGAKPGFVVYETYQTANVNPDLELVQSLLV